MARVPAKRISSKVVVPYLVVQLVSDAIISGEHQCLFWLFLQRKMTTRSSSRKPFKSDPAYEKQDLGYERKLAEGRGTRACLCYVGATLDLPV